MNALTLRISKLWIFIDVEVRRDTHNLLGFCAKYFRIFMLCFVYSFFFKSALWQKNILLDGHTIDFPLFLVSGVVGVRVIPLSIRIFDEILSGLKSSKLEEWVQTTPTCLWELFAAKALWNFARVLTELLTLIVFAHILVGVPIRPFFQGSLLLTVVWMFAAYAGIGMILSGLSVFLKQGGILFNFFFQISATFGGVFFPTYIFKGRLAFLAWVSNSLPITHALQVIRFGLIHEKTPSVAFHEKFLVMMTLTLLPVGFLLLQRSLVWARKNGNF